MPLLSQEQK